MTAFDGEIIMSERKVKKDYENMHGWEFYPEAVMVEYEQSIEEGLDIEQYKELFELVSRMPKNEIKAQLGDVIYNIVSNAPIREGYPYVEPSDLEGIRALRKEHKIAKKALSRDELFPKIHGAWMGRICGCMLGKTVEGIRTDELVPLLSESGNYPMHRYILRTDLPENVRERYKYDLSSRPYADEIDGMPADDDTNYVVLAQEVIRRYGRGFTADDMARAWMDLQPKYAYCTAERVAFCNFVRGYRAPDSATYKNAYREWIGAQIRGDYFGYINPGNCEMAAEMAFCDASISHIKNGIYGEMFASAMIAAAAACYDVKDVILCGLAEVPHTSRLYESVMGIIEGYESGVGERECFENIHKAYDEYSAHGWCHAISNAMIVAAALLYGKGDFGRSICMAVETGFDTDCNGATVGSVLGMMLGIDAIGEEWTAPINDKLETSIFGVGRVSISERARMTLEHLE